MACKTSTVVMPYEYLFKKGDNERRLKIWGDLLNTVVKIDGTQKFSKKDCYGAALGVTDADRAKMTETREDDVHTSSIGVFVGKERYNKKRNIFYIIYSCSTHNLDMLSKGIFGPSKEASEYENGVHPSNDINGTTFYKLMGNSFPAYTLLVTTDNTHGTGALEYAYLTESETDQNNKYKYRFWIEYNDTVSKAFDNSQNSNADLRFRCTDIAKDIFSGIDDNIFKYSGECIHSKTKQWNGSIKNSYTSGIKIKSLQNLFDALDRNDYTDHPIYIVLRPASFEDKMWSQLVVSLKMAIDFASAIYPGVGKFIGSSFNKLMDSTLGPVSKYATQIINTVKGWYEEQNFKKYFDGLLKGTDIPMIASNALRFLAPEKVRGVEILKDKIKYNNLENLFNNLTPKTDSESKAFYGVDKSKLTEIRNAVSGSGSGSILADFRGITEEAGSSADRFYNAQANLVNYKNYGILQSVASKALDNSSIDYTMGNFTDNKIIQQLGMTLSDQTLSSTIPYIGDLFGKVIGSKSFDSKKISSTYDNPENFYYNIIAGNVGIPSSASNWSDFIVDCYAAASDESKIKGQNNKVILQPTMDNDLRELIYCKLSEREIDTLKCGEGYYYDTNTNTCKRAGFFSQFGSSQTAIIGAGMLAISGATYYITKKINDKRKGKTLLQTKNKQKRSKK